MVDDWMLNLLIGGLIRVRHGDMIMQKYDKTGVN